MDMSGYKRSNISIKYKQNSTNLSNINEPSFQDNEGSENEEEKVSDSPRYITLTIKDKPFSVAFNSILMSSGLEAKLENGIVYVGPDVQDRIFSERISRIIDLIKLPQMQQHLIWLIWGKSNSN